MPNVHTPDDHRATSDTPANLTVWYGDYRFRRLRERDARQIAAWHYPPPYDFYDLPAMAWPEMLALEADFVGAELRHDPGPPGAQTNGSRVRQATRAVGDTVSRLAHRPTAAAPVPLRLAGFLCFGREAQVAGAADAGLYTDDALDIGLGMRPDLTGSGRGSAFVDACLAWIEQVRRPRVVRLSVATFNRRAITVYQRAGFEEIGTCRSPIRGTDVNFMVMIRRQPSVHDLPRVCG